VTAVPADQLASPPPRAPLLAAPRAAAGFLTRLPVGRLDPASASDLAAAAPWFPAVGLLVGGVCAGCRALAGLAFPAAPATLLGLAAAVLVTGGLHEDGLADCADGLGAHVDRTRRLEIMRDPRVGTYGVLALAFTLLLAFSLLAPLSTARFARVVVVAHVLARAAPLLQSRFAPPARPDGLGALLRVGNRELLFAAVIAAAVAIGLGGPGPGAAALGATLAVSAGGALLVRRRLGGTTGDTFGAAAKLVELACYAVFAGFWS
jgi:adenosylcobinamide-GDP ribazoletransferase